MSHITITVRRCITGEQQLCPDTTPNCGNDHMPTAGLGARCISPCTDYNGALYCFTTADNVGWGWCADQTGPCGNGHHCQFTHLHEYKKL